MNPSDAPAVPAQLDAFLEGACQTFGMLFGAEPDHTPFIPESAHAVAEREASVVVGFAGDVSGQIMLGMSREAAMGMAGTLLMAPVETFDEMTHSAIAEIANMTAGACATALHGRGWTANITVPTVILGDHVRVSWPNLTLYQATLSLPFGRVILAVGLKPDDEG
jgi:chemotaxis protein CheX